MQPNQSENDVWAQPPLPRPPSKTRAPFPPLFCLRPHGPGPRSGAARWRAPRVERAPVLGLWVPRFGAWLLCREPSKMSGTCIPTKKNVHQTLFVRDHPPKKKDIKKKKNKKLLRLARKPLAAWNWCRRLSIRLRTLRPSGWWPSVHIPRGSLAVRALLLSIGGGLFWKKGISCLQTLVLMHSLPAKMASTSRNKLLPPPHHQESPAGIRAGRFFRLDQV